MSENNFWSSSTSEILLNPRFGFEEVEAIKTQLESHLKPGRVYLRSSGTESGHKGIKIVELKKSSILAAAESVNRFLGASSTESWLNPLPRFHIGGLSISARCFLSQSQEFHTSQWDVDSFVEQLAKNEIRFTSLVPTQVFDLVQEEKRAPKILRAVLVGGGAIEFAIYQKACRLGWPLYPCYGMTETSAVIALGRPDQDEKTFNQLNLLPHVKLIQRGDKFSLESPALFESYLWITPSGVVEREPRPEPFTIDDRLKVAGDWITVLGRESELVKVLGETVNLRQLASQVAPFFEETIVILPVADARRGYLLDLIVESEHSSVDPETINQSLMPYEKIHRVHTLPRFPRSELGKISMSQIASLVYSRSSKQ